MWLMVLVGCGQDPLERAWHRSFEITSARSADATDGDCDPELAEGGVDAPYAFLAVSMGIPDIASLYLCDGPLDTDCPSQPIGNIWIRDWTTTELRGEAGVNSVFGDLCSLSWSGIDATRTKEGKVHLELRQASRNEPTPDPVDCDEALTDLIRSSCDSVLVLDGSQE
jgi:hypothetical protein